MEEGDTEMEEPEPTKPTPQLPEYQFQEAPVPNVPPEMLRVVDPLQMGFGLAEALDAAVEVVLPALMLNVVVPVQPLASVEVREKDPSQRPLTEEPEPPVLQLYVYDPLPPVEEAVAEPLHVPEHPVLVGLAVGVGDPKFPTVPLLIEVHPLPSVTVTV